MKRILTLTTDFGTRDAYVAAMKGLMLQINPDVQLIDVTHEIAPHDIMEAAFVLLGALPYFPAGTTHLVVVDPGVGTDRPPIALRKGGHLFVGPDNGLFSLVLEGEQPDELVRLDQPDFWRTPHPSRTFHGRDLFAPAAAHLSAGRPLQTLGSPHPALKRLQWALPIQDEQGIQGWVVHIDHFGNCITNIARSHLDTGRREPRLKCFVGGTILDQIHNTYADVAQGDPVLLLNSEGRLEIAVHAGNASSLLSIRKGDPINLLFF